MSSDEDFVVFGTPLIPIEEDDVVRKRPKTVEDQVAKDKYGRRRFHGAFTGGFSAGYFNSVGSAEGWTPSTFKSSRGQKFQNQSQKPEDFMDDEDMGEFGIAPKMLRLKDNYDDSESSGSKKRSYFVGSEGPIPGKPVLLTLLEPVRSTIGVKLLKKMGWKFGQGVGPRLRKHEKRQQRRDNKTKNIKIYGCALPSLNENVQSHRNDSCESDYDEYEDDNEDITFAPDDYDPYIVKPKDNFFGIGYSGLDRRNILSYHINLFEPSFTVKEKSKKFSIRGKGFGVGALEEEDEDIYCHDDMSQYDFSLDIKPSSSEKQKNKQQLAITASNEPIEGFVAASTVIKNKLFPPPKLLPGFQPIHSIKRSRFEPAQDKTKKQGLHRHDLSTNERAIILDEPTRFDKAKAATGELQSSSAVIESSSVCRDNSDNVMPIVSIKTEPIESDSSKGIGRSKVFKPFLLSDPDKQRRYEQYLRLVKNGQKDKLSTLQPLSMTEWERERERVEFEQAERLYRPISAVFNDRFVSASQSDDSTNLLAKVQRTIDDQKDLTEAAKKKMFGLLTRKVYLWAPSSLLCKRFNIREPNSSKEFDGKKVSKMKPKFSVFNFLEAATSNITSISNIASSSSQMTDLHDPETRSSVPAGLVNDSVLETEIENVSSIDIELSSDKNEKIDSKLVIGGQKDISVNTDLDVGGNKEDLYKAIFLSSSDESEDEKEKEMNKNLERDKSVNELPKNDHRTKFVVTNEASHTILSTQQPASLLNTLRNTSPPRGIFANLDLDLFNSKKSINTVLNIRNNSESTVNNKKNAENLNEEKQVQCDKSGDEVVNLMEKKSDVEGLLLYGPTLPTKMINNDKDSSKCVKTIKKIVEYNNSEDDSGESSDEWIESDKISKKHKNKKQKKEHKRKKHKKHKKHKH